MAEDEKLAQRGGIGELRHPAASEPAPLRRASLEEAIAWLDAHGSTLPPEEIGLGEAAGRVAAAEVISPRPVPAGDCAAADGFALRAAETVGAGDYNPLRLSLLEPAAESGGRPGALPPSSAAPIVAGAVLPPGADAVLPFDLAQEKGAALEVFGAVPEGWGIARQGRQLQAGARLVERGRVLLPQDVGLLAWLGIRRVPAVRRPRVRLLVSEPKARGANSFDANGPMLRALVARDGGVVAETGPLAAGPQEDLRTALARALSTGGADLTLVAGRSGRGWDDAAAKTVAELGKLAMHGVALRPGGSAGMGLLGSEPVLLLPGDPLECWSAYEMLAGRLIRRMGGRSPELPYAVREVEAGRKIVSAIGVVDLCRVRLEKGMAEPLGPAESGGLASAVRADGFVIVPAASEGYAPGARLEVYMSPGGVRTQSNSER
jgi:molybdopterin molybdotransferase